MSPGALTERTKEYRIENAIDQENVLQELAQQYLLAGLARAGFFSRAGAVFHGGTCLRLVFGMNRFSEDLDFFLKRPDRGFAWHGYIDRILKDAAGDGFRFTVADKSNEEERDKRASVKKAMLRLEATSAFAAADLPFARDPRKLIKVKFEIDTNPPPGSTFGTRYIAFPTTAAITVQSLESGFGMKLGALLARPYVKGRDWYDFIWYVNKKIVPDLGLLENALKQQGPWAGRDIPIDADWIVVHLHKKIAGIDWKDVRRDVQRFLPLREQEALTLWDRQFFLHYAGLLRDLMS
jgi:predicted nucleotidyltransferase component of viral defense system